MQQLEPILSEAAASSAIPSYSGQEANQRPAEGGRNFTSPVQRTREQSLGGDDELQHANITHSPCASARNGSYDGDQVICGSSSVETNAPQILTSRPSLGVLYSAHALDENANMPNVANSALNPQLTLPTQQSHIETLTYDKISGPSQSALAEVPTLPSIAQNATTPPEDLCELESITNNPGSEIDLTGDDSDDDPAQDSSSEQDIHGWISQQHEADTKGPPTPNSQPVAEQHSPCIRNPPITSPLLSLPEYIHNGIKLNPKANIDLLDGDFMRIVSIIREPTTTAITLRGHIFRRTKEMNGILSKKYNELCWILHVDEDDPRHHHIQAMESVPVSQVLRRRKIRLTNQPFPACSFREDEGGMLDDEETVLNERVLVCRTKYVCAYKNASEREQYNWSEKALLRIRAEECDPLLAKDDRELRFDWRGPTVEGGACEFWEPEEKQFLQNEGQVQQDLCVANANRPLGEGATEHRSRNSVVRDLDSSATSPAPDDEDDDGDEDDDDGGGDVDNDDDDLVEIPNPMPEARRTFVDLTEGNIDSVLSRVSDLSFSEELAASTQRQAGRRQPETVEINVVINRTTPQGTVRKKIEGRVTTTLIPNTSTLSGLKRLSADPAGSSLATKRRRLGLNGGRRSISRQSSVHPSNTLESGNSLNNECSSRATSITSNAHGAQGRASGWSSPSQDSLPPYSRPTSPLTSFHPPEPVAGNNLAITYAGGHVKEQRYTFGDCFCGAGGVSRGAVMANLRVSWAFDFNRYACDSYRLNNPTTALYPIAAYDFCALKSPRSPFLIQPATSTQIPTSVPNAPSELKVDILHLSPPCQYFSNAHTVVGRDDEMNTASLFSVQELVRKARPRVVTLEQTSGLLRRHEVWFNAVVLMFTSQGFSVRWRQLNCADFGVPQRRVRCFLVASWLVTPLSLSVPFLRFLCCVFFFLCRFWLSSSCSVWLASSAISTRSFIIIPHFDTKHSKLQYQTKKRKNEEKERRLTSPPPKKSRRTPSNPPITYSHFKTLLFHTPSQTMDNSQFRNHHHPAPLAQPEP